MSYNYTLRYRTFDQLLSDIQVDFQNLTLQDMIEPQQLIKVAKRVNYDLGLRIFKTKEVLLEVEKFRVRLPDDFFTLNFSLICDEVTTYTTPSQGTWIEERPIITPYQSTPSVIDPCVASTVNCQTCNNTPCGCPKAACLTCNTCNSSPCGCNSVINVPPHSQENPYGSYCQQPRTFLNCKGDAYELVQIVNSTQQNTYRRLLPIRLLQNAQSIDCDCPNLYWNSGATAWIQDNFLHTNFECGNVYINYQGMLDDGNGNLLVPDHDMLNEYYEYAVKQRILENSLMNDDPQAVAKLQLVETRLRAARNYALSIVNTPNFSEMKQVWEMNRKAQYSKYYDMFKSYSPNQRTLNSFRY